MKLQDTIKSINVDDDIKMKNIKGQCTLELINAKTGKVEKKSEHHNIITDAISEWYRAGGMSNPSAFTAQAIRESAIHYLLGGVMLLDSDIDDDETIIKVPSGITMTGNGVIGVQNGGNPPELGSYNELESGWQSDGSFKMVWDWNTAQGNGTIRTICLSSRFGAYKGIGNKSLTNKTIDVHMGTYNGIYSFNNTRLTDVITYLGAWDNKAMFFKRGATAMGYDTAGDWNILVASSPYTKMDMRDGQYRREIETKSISHAVDLHEYGNGTSKLVQVGKYAYLTVAYAHTSGSYYTRYFHFDNDYPVYVLKFDLESLTLVDTIELSPRTTGAQAFVMSGGVYPTMSANGKWAIFHNLLFDLSNLTNVTEIGNFTEDTEVTFISDDIAESNTKRLDATIGEFLPTNYTDNTYYNPVWADKIFGVNTDYVYRDPRYIASIWKPESPYTKDASMMMKVTYTLRFDGGE